MVTALGLGAATCEENTSSSGHSPKLNGPGGDSERIEGHSHDVSEVCWVEEAARKLMVAARAYVPVSHLCWGLWGLIQAGVSRVDFDFEAYARQRIHEYLVTKSLESGQEMA